MNELSLFTGAGGGILGTHLLGWRPIGYVEWDDYCQRVLAARIADGFIPAAPIFGDVREFVQSGAAEQYRGFADVVTAGFPCQPHSEAGLRRGADDERDMWPATRDCIRAVRPRFVVLENVPGILTGYAAVVTADLAAMGYLGRSGCISASSVGAPHRRERWWVVAHANDTERRQERGSCDGLAQRADGVFGEGPQGPGGLGASGEVLANSDSGGFALERSGSLQHRERTPFGNDTDRRGSATAICYANGTGQQERTVLGNGEGKARGTSERQAIERTDWWKSEPDVGRVAHELPNRMDKFGADEP